MEQTQDCSNCGKPISVSKAATHFGYCRRNIIKCATCGMMYDKNFLEDHEEEFHSNSKCQHCSRMLKKSEVEEHSKICLMKPKHCEYCDLNVPAKDFSAHFKQCESRTSPCTLCEKPITNKQFAIHTATCKGKTQPVSKHSQNNGKIDNKYNFQDSLTQFWQYNAKAEKQSPAKSNRKKQSTMSSSSKKPVEVKPDFKKPSDPKALSRQHFYQNYLNPTSMDYSDYDLQQNFGQLNVEDSYDYLPQQSFYGRDAFAFQTPSSFEYMNHEPSQLETEEQLIQQTLFESSKRNKLQKKQHLPSDFFSEDIMNQSFYKDILDLEKQKAILEDLSKNTSKKPAAGKPEPKVTKPSSKNPVVPVKNERRK